MPSAMVQNTKAPAPIINQGNMVRSSSHAAHDLLLTSIALRTV